MTPAAAGALLHLQNATTADEALDWIWQAHGNGASWTECREAYAEWERLQVAQVRTVDPLCRCGDAKVNHTTDRNGRGICRSAVCACGRFEEKA